MCFQNVSGSAHCFSSPFNPPSVGPPVSFQSVTFTKVFPQVGPKSCCFSTHRLALTSRACCQSPLLSSGALVMPSQFSSYCFPCPPWYYYVLNNFKCWVRAVHFLLFIWCSEMLALFCRRGTGGEVLTCPRFTLQMTKAGCMRKQAGTRAHILNHHLWQLLELVSHCSPSYSLCMPSSCSSLCRNYPPKHVSQ